MIQGRSHKKLVDEPSNFMNSDRKPKHLQNNVVKEENKDQSEKVL